MLFESLKLIGKVKLREEKAFTQHHTAHGTQDRLFHRPDWVPD